MTTRSTHSTRRRLVLGVIVTLVAVAGLTGVGTSAWFTDTDAIDANTFTSGNVSLLTNPTTNWVSKAAMAPGDKATFPIVVTNDGSLELRYSLKSQTTEIPLAAALQLTIRVGATSCTDTSFTGGTVVYATGILGSTTAGQLFGNPAAGIHTGDRVLAGAATETLCAQVVLPTTAPGTVEGLTTTATFTFDSEQTANNP